MFTKLLVPLDGTTGSAVALPAARTLAKATGANLTLVRVVPPANIGADETALKQAKTYLTRIAAELVPGGLHVQTVVRQGLNPAEEIVRDAVSGGADLIVMTTHGRGGVQRAIMGSTAQGVVARSPEPVMLLRPGGRRLEHLRTILVPVDGTPGAALALGAAVPLAQATGARVVLVQAAVPSADYYLQGLTLTDLGLDEEMLAAAQQYVTGLAGRLERAQVSAEGRAQLGQPRKAIVETAENVDADLIVMSTHALTGPARAVLGSVADEVVRGAHQPVLLVRQHASGRVPTNAKPHAAFVV